MIDSKGLRKYAAGQIWELQKQSDQNKGVPAPAVMLRPSGAPVIELPDPQSRPDGGAPFFDLVRQRCSRRVFADRSMTLWELSYVLYCCQGYKYSRPGQESYAALRTVPSAGCRHPLDTYVAVKAVEGVPCGVYRFLPKEHALELVKTYEKEELEKLVSDAMEGQIFCGKAPVSIIWAADMYRCEWRYPMAAHKLVLLDAGHACQNLYLACEEIGLGVCAIGAYDQKVTDALIEVDGENVFTIYAASLGARRD